MQSEVKQIYLHKKQNPPRGGLHFRGSGSWLPTLPQNKKRPQALVVGFVEVSGIEPESESVYESESTTRS